LTIIAISHQAPLVDVADRVYRVGDGTAALVTDVPHAPPQAAALKAAFNRG
jgi:hypothetical protein